MAPVIMTERPYEADRIRAQSHLYATVMPMFIVHHQAYVTLPGVVTSAIDGIPKAMPESGRKTGIRKAAWSVNTAIRILAS